MLMSKCLHRPDCRHAERYVNPYAGLIQKFNNHSVTSRFLIGKMLFGCPDLVLEALKLSILQI